MTVALIFPTARADTPASQVFRQTVGPNQSYPEVGARSEGWFDVGGFCKVVDVGDLSWATPPVTGIPVFVPGDSGQWKNWRNTAPTDYHSQLTSTTCCRPQSNVATLCAGAANPQPVSRQYGRLNETDTLTATCVTAQGQQYPDNLSVTCLGDNGPDGQASWTQTADVESPPPACVPQAGSCSSNCNSIAGTDNCGNSCFGTQVCPSCTPQQVCWDNTGWNSVGLFNMPIGPGGAYYYAYSGCCANTGTVQDFAVTEPQSQTPETWGQDAFQCRDGSLVEIPGNSICLGAYDLVYGGQPAQPVTPPASQPATCGVCNQSTGQKSCSDGSTQACALATVGGATCDNATRYSQNPNNPFSCQNFCGCGDAVCGPVTWTATAPGYATPVPFTVEYGCDPANSTGQIVNGQSLPPTGGCNLSGFTFQCQQWQ